MTATRKPILAVLLGLALTGCGKLADEWFCSSEGCAWNEGEWARIASLANPDGPPGDPSNRFRFNLNAQLMGQALFFDPAFSGSATQQDAIRRPSPPARADKGQPIGISCATCHDLARAGIDTTSEPGHVSVGAGWTDVNALGVVNSAYRPVVFWNGRADSLWALNAVVAESATTMNGNRLRTAHVLADRYLKSGAWRADPDLLSELSYLLRRPVDCAVLMSVLADVDALPPDGKPGAKAGCQPDDPSEPFGDAFDCLSPDRQRLVTSLLVVWAKAIAAYESQLNSIDSPFDRFVREGPSSDAISPAAKRGARLFVGKGACIDCHGGTQLTDEQFHNIGVPQVGLAVPTTADCPQGNAACDCSEDHAGRPCAPWGAYDGIPKLGASKWLRSSEWSDDPSDRTRDAYIHRAQTEDLKGAWRTPSLRNVALTAPYMHDGRYATLEDVIWHYNTGGLSAGPEQIGVPAAEMKPLLLTESEQADLVAFLGALTGPPIRSDLAAPPALPPTLPLSCSGAGGSGGSAGPGCAGTPPASPLIADFSDAQGTPPATFGTAPNITGAFFAYAAPGLTPPALSVQPGGNGTPALRVAVHPGAAVDTASTWLGFGMSFDSCVDATMYDAVRFTLSSDLGTCPIRFAVMSSQTVSMANDPRGSCTTEPCYPPSMPIVAPGTITVPFSGFSFPGNPNVVDPRSLIGIQWQMDTTTGVSCDSTFTIDDIMFVRVGPTGAGGFGGSSGPGSGGGGGMGPPPSGAGGAGGAPPPPLTCAPTALPSPLITDFTGARGGNPVLFGVPPGITGRTFYYAPAGAPLPPPPTLMSSLQTTPPALQFMARLPMPSATAAGFFGFGLIFDNCVDASVFGGVRLAIDNRLASCPVEFALTSRANVTAAEDPRGTCPTLGCPPPFTSLPQSGVVTIPIPPAGPPFAPQSVIGVQWRAPASCGMSLTVDDIWFTP